VAEVDRMEVWVLIVYYATYVQIMVTDHDKTVSAFEDASSTTKDLSLKAFIDKTLPVLRQHKEHIHAIESKDFHCIYIMYNITVSKEVAHC
jgi:Domain of unknown function (DUF4142)